MARKAETALVPVAPGTALPAGRAAPPMGAGAVAPEGLDRFLGAVQTARGFLAETGRRPRMTLRGRWYPHLPELAVALAEMLERCPAPFARLGFGAADLRAERGRIGDLETARAGLLAVLADLDGELAVRKGRLADGAQLLVASARAQLADPLGDHEELKGAAQKALVLLGRFNARRTKTRRRTERTRRAAAPPPARR